MIKTSHIVIATLLVCILLNIIAIPIIINYNKDVTNEKVVDVDKIDTYGKLYPLCNNLKYNNTKFINYVKFNCSGKCSDYCDIYWSHAGTESYPNSETFNKKSVSCISINVETYHTIYFDKCYNFTTIDWSIIMINGSVSPTHIVSIILIILCANFLVVSIGFIVYMRQPIYPPIQPVILYQ